MNSDNTINNNNLREALSKYESQFIMPESLISDTMKNISRQNERRAYIRGILIAAFAAIIIITAAALLMTMLAESSLTATGASMIRLFTETKMIIELPFSNPIITLVIISTLVLLLADHFLRTHLARHKPSHSSIV